MNVDKSIKEIEKIFSPFMKNSYDVLAEKLDSKKESTKIWNNFMEYLYHGYIAEENPVIKEIFQKSLKLVVIDVISVLGPSLTASSIYCDHLYQQALDASGILTKSSTRPEWASRNMPIWASLIVIVPSWFFFSMLAMLNVANGSTVIGQIPLIALGIIFMTYVSIDFGPSRRYWPNEIITSIITAVIFIVTDVGLVLKIIGWKI